MKIIKSTLIIGLLASGSVYAEGLDDTRGHSAGLVYVGGSDAVKFKHRDAALVQGYAVQQGFTPTGMALAAYQTNDGSNIGHGDALRMAKNSGDGEKGQRIVGYKGYKFSTVADHLGNDGSSTVDVGSNIGDSNKLGDGDVWNKFENRFKKKK